MPDRPHDDFADPSLFDLGLAGPQDDAVVARVFAERLLIVASRDRNRCDARLLLTIACLHLQSRPGPEPTLADLVQLLGGSDGVQVLAKIQGGPLSLTEYALAELGSLTPELLSLALEFALEAAKLAQAAQWKNTA